MRQFLQIFVHKIQRIFLTLALAVAIAAGAFEPVSFNAMSGFMGTLEAQAQSAKKKKKRRSLFSILFGKKKSKKKAKKTRSKRKTAKRKTKKRKSRKSAKRKKRAVAGGAAAVAKKKIEKIKDAKVVLVVGDFLAGQLADGLVKALEDNPVVRVVDKSRGSSGFVRTDIVKWSERIAELKEEIKPAYIVAMLGTNDRQLMKEDGKRLKKRTPEWDAAYQKRVSALGDSLKATGIPFTWVGLPSVKYKSMSKDFLVFNEWYQNAATKDGGKFADVWDGFADAEGAYSRSGPDINGQIVLLRTKNGINFTRAGRRRIAFYVEGTIRKQLGDGAGLIASSLDELGGLAASAPREPSYDPARSGKTVVISLDDPKVDGASELAGGEAKAPIVTSVTVPVAVSGTREAGRADNYAWPPADGLVEGQPGAVAATN